MNEINKVNPARKSNEQKKVLYNINMLYKSGDSIIKLFNDYSSVVFELIQKAAKGKGIKILTTKQKLQRLLIALAQFKVDNTSKSLLNKISGKLLILCIELKKLLKKYTLIQITTNVNRYYISELQK